MPPENSQTLELTHPGLPQAGLQSELFRKSAAWLIRRTFNLQLSQLLVPLISLRYSDASRYLEQFCSANRKRKYCSLQDFLERRYIDSPIGEATEIWPCEGTLQDSRPPAALYEFLPANHVESFYTAEIRVGVQNYRRIHSPIEGRVLQVVRRPRGDEAAITLKLIDTKERPWVICVSRKFGLEGLQFTKSVKVGTRLHLGEEIGLLQFGSSVHILGPTAHSWRAETEVYVGMKR